MAFKTKDMTGVYILKAPNSWHCYVGSSQNCASRIRCHFYMLRGGRHPNHILQRAFSKYGESLQGYVVQIIDRNTFERYPYRLLDLEEEWMERLPSVYNISKSAYSPANDPAIRKRISQSLSGRKMSSERLARHVVAMRDPETNAKRRAKMKGRKFSEEHLTNHRAMMSTKWFRRRVAEGLKKSEYVVSEETCRRISKSLRGRKLSAEHCRNIGRGYKGIVKLAKREVAAIRKAHDPQKATFSYRLLASQFSVSWLTIFNVVNKRAAYA